MYVIYFLMRKNLPVKHIEDYGSVQKTKSIPVPARIQFFYDYTRKGMMREELRVY